MLFQRAILQLFDKEYLYRYLIVIVEPIQQLTFFSFNMYYVRKIISDLGLEYVVYTYTVRNKSSVLYICIYIYVCMTVTST